MKQNTIISASTIGMSVVIAAVVFVAQTPGILQGNLSMPAPIDMIPTDTMTTDNTVVLADTISPEEMADLADDEIFAPGAFDEIIADDTDSFDEDCTGDVYGEGLTGDGCTTGGNAAQVCKNETVSKHGNNVGKGTGIDLDPAKAIAAAKAQATKMAQDGCKNIEKSPDAIDPTTCKVNPKTGKIDPTTCQPIVPACKPSDKCVSGGVTAAYTDDKNNPVQVTLTQPYKTNKKWKAVYTTSGTCKSTRTCAPKQ